MRIKPVLVPDHDAAALRGLMDSFAEASTGPTKRQLTESRAAVAAAQGVSEGPDKGWVPNPDNPGYYIHRSDLPQTGKVSDPAKAKLGRIINKYFGQIYDYGDGDESLNYLDNNAPLWFDLFDKHDGDIDAIIANEPADVLKQAALELKNVANDLKYELDEQVVTEGFMDTVKQAFNDCVVGYPQGTSEGQFIQGWARAIRAETGRDIPLEKLTRLYQDYAERSDEIMQSHGTLDEGSAEDNLNELDKSTLGSYVKKAAADVNTKSRDAQQHKDMWAGNYPVRGAKKQARQNQADIDKRVGGISRAVDRLAAEDVAEGVNYPDELRDKMQWLMTTYHMRSGEAEEAAYYDEDPATWKGSPWEDEYTGVTEGELTAYQKLLKQMRQNAKNDPNRIPRGYELSAHGELVKKHKTEKSNDGVGGLGEGLDNNARAVLRNRIVADVLNFYSLNDRIPSIKEFSRPVRAKLNALEFDERSTVFRQAVVQALKLLGKQGMSAALTLDEAGRPDVMRHRGDTTVKVVKRGGRPIGEIGIDAEASEGNGQYYVKLYDGSYDAVGFDTAAEALAELKYAISEGLAEVLGTSPDRLMARTGMNLSHKFPRTGQTNLGNIPGTNLPDSSEQTKKYGQERRANRPDNLKAAIRDQLGKHNRPDLPESGVTEARNNVSVPAALEMLKDARAYLDQFDPEDDDDYFDAYETIAAEFDMESNDSSNDPLTDLLDMYEVNPQQAAQMLADHLQSQSKDVTEGWKSKLAAVAGAAALGAGGAQAQSTDRFDPAWGTSGYNTSIRSDVSSTKSMNTADPSKDVNDFQKRIQSVTGPNAKGEYKVVVIQGNDIVSHYITKTPPPGWLYKEDVESKTEEGMIDNIKNTVRAANYDRLARRSNSQAVAGGGLAPPAQFRALSDKGDQRAQKAQDIRKGDVAQQVEEGIDPVEQLRADIRRFSR